MLFMFQVCSTHCVILADSIALMLVAMQSPFLGTIKHTQLAAIRHNREVIARFRARAKTPGIPIIPRDNPNPNELLRSVIPCTRFL